MRKDLYQRMRAVNIGSCYVSRRLKGGERSVATNDSEESSELIFIKRGSAIEKHFKNLGFQILFHQEVLYLHH